MSFTGAVTVNGGCSTYKGSEQDPDDIAERAVALYRDPSSGVTFFQQNAFLGRVIMTRKAFKRHDADDPMLWDEFRVFRERKLDSYVLLTEAIEALCPTK
ncbi:MAG: hypothetical protein IK093_05185, partial [Ruminiclostridium sp.]|nr:hypothetical protein [Ruminiclostridium sp.]